MSKKKIKSIVAGVALTAVLTTPVVVGGVVAIKTGYNTPSDYAATACVEYNGEKYQLFSLYKLISESGEEHLCRLVSSSHLEYGLRLRAKGLGFGLKLVKDPKVYVDLSTGEEVAIEGCEEAFGYQIEVIADLFPFEEYGSRERVTIPQETFESVLESNSIGGKSR